MAETPTPAPQQPSWRRLTLPVGVVALAFGLVLILAFTREKPEDAGPPPETPFLTAADEVAEPPPPLPPAQEAVAVPMADPPTAPSAPAVAIDSAAPSVPRASYVLACRGNECRHRSVTA